MLRGELRKSEVVACRLACVAEEKKVEHFVCV
jgi:hypothetical protein